MEDFLGLIVILGLPIVFLFYFILKSIGPTHVEDLIVGDDDKEYSFKNFYFKLAKKHRFRVKFRITILIVLAILNIVSIFYSFSDYDTTGNIALLLPLGLYTLILIYTTIFSILSIRLFIPKKSYYEITQDNYKNIWDLCNNFISILKLQNIKLKLYYVKSNGINAHVAYENNIAHLFVSRGLLSHSFNSMKEVETILGHEFGHIVQGDTKLFLITKGAFNPVKGLNLFSIVIAFFGLLLSLCIGAPTLIWTPLLTQILVGLFYQRLFNGMTKLRKESEFLADFCSLITVEDSQIHKIIEDYVPDIDTANYPSKKDRLTSIKIANKKRVNK